MSNGTWPNQLHPQASPGTSRAPGSDQRIPNPADSAVYGIHQWETWVPGEAEQRPLVNMMPSDWLWFCEVSGFNLRLEVSWGTITRTVRECALPLAASLAGQVNIYGTPLDDSGALAQVAVTKTSATASVMRSPLITAAGPLPANASSFTALGAGTTVTVAGVPVAVAPGQTIPLIGAAVLGAGSGFVGFGLSL